MHTQQEWLLIISSTEKRRGMGVQCTIRRISPHAQQQRFASYAAITVVSSSATMSLILSYKCIIV